MNYLIFPQYTPLLIPSNEDFWVLDFDTVILYQSVGVIVANS